MQETQSSGERDNIRDVFDFAAFDFAIFGVMIAKGEQFTDGGEARAAVGLAHDVVGHKTVFESPGSPDTGYGGRGIDEDAVHVEEDCAALDRSHRQN